VLELIFRRSKFILAISMFLLSVIAIGTTKLEITPDNRVFYGKDSEKFLELTEFEDQFEVNSVVVFAITSEKSLFDSKRFRDGLSWMDREVAGVKNFVRSISVISIPHAYSDDGEVTIGRLLSYVCPDACIEHRQGLVVQERYAGRLVSPDAKSLAVYAVIDVDPSVVTDVSSTHASINVLANNFRKEFPELQLTITGAIPMMQAFVDTAAADSVGVLGAAFGVILIFLCISLGSWRIGGLVFLNGMLASLVSLGVAGWLGYTLNTATSIVPVVVFTLVVAGSMHLVVHFLQRFGDGVADPQINIRASFKAQFAPMALASVTSCVSLLSLLWVESPPIRELGFLSAVGVLAGFILSFLFLGLILPLIPVNQTRGFIGIIRRWLNKFAKKSERSNLLGYFVVIFFCVSSSGLYLLEIDDDFIRYFDSSVKFRQDVEEMVSLGVGSPYHIEIVVTAPAAGEALDTSMINYVRNLQGDLRKRDEVMNVTSIIGVIEDIAMAFDTNILLANDQIINQLFLSYELGLPTGQTSVSLIDSDHRSLRISVLLRDVTSKETKTLENWIYERHKDVGPVGTKILVTGENIPVAHLSQENIEEMLQGMVVVLVLVSMVMALITRRINLFWISLVAIAFPISAGFGIWGWTIGYIGLSATIILAVTIGVVIDDAIHIVYRYEDGRNELGLESKESASYAIHKAGPAVVTTSLCLSIGFALLYFSSYAVNQVFGIAACLIFALAMLFDLIVLPKLLALQRFD